MRNRIFFICPEEANMNIRLKLSLSALLMVLAGVMYGCGGGSSSSTSLDTSIVRTGSVVQGPVSGSTVFADSLASGTRFVLDGGEVSATTDASGRYVLPTMPGYDYVMVSTGGIDTITGQPAIMLLAPAGSANITPLTTLVALDTNQAVRAKIEALQGGLRYDTNVSANSSTAVLALIKSVETAVQSLSTAISTKSGDTLTAAQINGIQALTLQQIALAFGSTSENLAIPSKLTAVLTTALGNALTAIGNANTGVETFGVLAATVATDAVNAAGLSLTGFDATTATALSSTAGAIESIVLTSPQIIFAAPITAAKAAPMQAMITGSFTPSSFSTPPVNVISTPVSVVIKQISTGSTGSSGGSISF
jgi:hypothetical protein